MEKEEEEQEEEEEMEDAYGGEDGGGGRGAGGGLPPPPTPHVFAFSSLSIPALPAIVLFLFRSSLVCLYGLLSSSESLWKNLL